MAVRLRCGGELDATAGAADREDLAFRYLAGGLQPDDKTLSEFLRRHRRAINDVFTQVVQMARRAGMGKLGHVAIDSTRVRANASRQRMVEVADRQQWAQDRRLVRAFQQKAAAQDPEEDGGVKLSRQQQEKLSQQEIPALPKKGRQQLSTTDPESRFCAPRKVGHWDTPRIWR